MGTGGATVAAGDAGERGVAQTPILAPVPFLLTGTIVYSFLVLAILVVASELGPNTFGGELTRSLVTELVGFFLTATVIGAFVRRETQQARELTAQRRRKVARREALLVHNELTRLAANAGSFGPQYVESLERLQSLVERLDVDLTNLWLVETPEHAANAVLDTQEKVRLFREELLSALRLLRSRDLPLPFPPSLMLALEQSRVSLATHLLAE